MATTTEPATKKPSKIITFFKGVWSELKKVHWPTKKQLINYTGVVLLTCVLAAVIISAYDWIVSTLVELLLSLV